MFLFERLFGVGVYMLTLLVMCIFLSKTDMPCKYVLRIYLACLCIMAFFYMPYKTADLFRIFEQMKYFATIDFGVFWKQFVLESSIPMSRLLFWCIGMTGVYSLLPMLSAFVCYSLLFYIISKTKEKFNISNQTVALVIFFIMTTSIYISAIGGIRMMLALCMIAYSYFRSTVEKKVNVLDILFYAIPVFLHAMSLVVLVICALVFLFDSDKNVVRKIGYAVLIALVGGVFAFQFSDSVHNLYQKFLDYVLEDKHSDPWEYAMGILIILVLLMLFVEFRRVSREWNCDAIKKYNSAALVCVVLALCFCFEFSIFYRFGGQLAILFAIPSMMVVLEKSKGRASSLIIGIDFRSILLVFSVLIALISCSRGSLCSLKFFELQG